MRTARGAGRAAGLRAATLLPALGRLAAVFVAAGFLAAGFFDVERALVVEVGDGLAREVCFLALGDRVLEPLLRDEPDPDVLLLREPVGEDVRVAMPPT